MASRLALHKEFEQLLQDLNIDPQNVYFQPPESIRMNYPCIVYKRSSGRTFFANNNPYTFEKSYEVTVIDRNPDSQIIDAIAMHFPKSRFNRHMTVNNLNHDVFVIYWNNNSKEE